MKQTTRTTLNLDAEALAGALEVAPGMTRTALINQALRDFVRRRRLRDLLKLGGKGGAPRWQGDLDALRKRGTRPR